MAALIPLPRRPSAPWAALGMALMAAMPLPAVAAAHPIRKATAAVFQAAPPGPRDKAAVSRARLPAFEAKPDVRRWSAFIAEASARFQLPQDWIAAVMQAESGGRTRLYGHPITSRAGAMGLMQLMPDTWNDLRTSLDLGHDPYDPHDNILAGTAYLKAMYTRFGYPGLFAAYNAGPARYVRNLSGGEPLPSETRAYIALLARSPASPDMPPAILSGARLFFALSKPQPLIFPVKAAAENPSGEPSRDPSASASDGPSDTASSLPSRPPQTPFPISPRTKPNAIFVHFTPASGGPQ